MLSAVAGPRLSASPAPPPQGRIDEARVQQTLDRYLNDDWTQRVQVGRIAGAGIAAAGVGATGLGILSRAPGLLNGAWGVGVATGLGALGGIALGVYCTKRYMQGQSAFMNAYLLATIGGFGGLITAFSAQAAGGPVGLLAATGVALLAGVAGGAMRMGASTKAQKDVESLEKDIDRATELEGIVLRNAKADEKAAQPGGQVKVEDDYIVVGGIRVPRGEQRP